MTHRLLLALAVARVAAGCAGHAPDTAGGVAGARSPRGGPVDAQATPETRALFANLRVLARDHVMFGHQDDLAYGVTWNAENGRSDVKESAGAYPAVYGWDASGIERGSPVDIDRVRFDDERRWIAEGYARGGVITLSWHLNNPVSGGNAWDTTRAVASVLPGGARHALYREWLDRLAAFVAGLRGPGGEPIPVVFRPYHEMTGSWFWWGGRNATPEEYKALWRLTVSYLRDTAGVHNLLYAYSTDVFDSKAQYLEHYPGDEWVDLLGYDDYHAVKTAETRPVLVRRLRDIVELAEARGKIAAMTETGVLSVPDSTWWTGTLLGALESDPVARRIAWVLVWRNATTSPGGPVHFYAPYAGQASAPDFKRFHDDPLILFEDELPDLYRPGAPPRRPAAGAREVP